MSVGWNLHSKHIIAHDTMLQKSPSRNFECWIHATVRPWWNQPDFFHSLANQPAPASNCRRQLLTEAQQLSGTPTLAASIWRSRTWACIFAYRLHVLWINIFDNVVSGPKDVSGMMKERGVGVDTRCLYHFLCCMSSVPSEVFGLLSIYYNGRFFVFFAPRTTSVCTWKKRGLCQSKGRERASRFLIYIWVPSCGSQENCRGHSPFQKNNFSAWHSWQLWNDKGGLKETYRFIWLQQKEDKECGRGWVTELSLVYRLDLQESCGGRNNNQKHSLINTLLYIQHQNWNMDPCYKLDEFLTIMMMMCRHMWEHFNWKLRLQNVQHTNLYILYLK